MAQYRKSFLAGNMGKAQTKPGKVRIIAGSLKGSRLPVHVAPGLRPTLDRVRETVFNWLAPYMQDSACLDLFAGSGALGFEAHSRGAGRVVLLEQDAKLTKSLAAQAERLRIAHGIEIERADALAYLSQPAPEKFDIVFVDPPFALSCWEEVFVKLAGNQWTKPGGLVFFETPKNIAVTVPNSWTLWRESHAGDVDFRLYQVNTAFDF